MRVVRYIQSLPPELTGAAVAVGNFDGLHLGHRAVLELMMSRAEALKAPKAVLTFEPHPRAYFDKASAPARLLSLAEKLRSFKKAGVDIVYVLRFNEALASMPAEQFIHHVLSEQLKIKDITVGDGFVFGKGRLGNVGLIKAGAEFSGKFTANALPPVFRGVEPVSSSRIRALLDAGEVESIAALYGREFRITGPVISGDKRARTIGYPTANIGLHPMLATPSYGVYIVEAQRAGEKDWQRAVANIGVRPTFGEGKRPLLEVHVLDQSLNLYGSKLSVRFIKRLRPEKRFDSLASLAAQIARDALAARQFFAARDAEESA